MRKKIIFIICIVIATIFSGCLKERSYNQQNNSLSKANVVSEHTTEVVAKDQNKDLIKEIILDKYQDKKPLQWGESVQGVVTRLDTKDKVIALTFDACGGEYGSGYDKELIDYLIKEEVPATLFINYRWIDSNLDTFLSLCKNPLFEIENHGYAHRPLSINGKAAYGIQGTANLQEAEQEVISNEEKIETLTGKKPRYFRPGTAYSDEVAASIVKDLGEEEVGFTVLGDAGATFSKEQIRQACLSAKPGSIIICHINHPEKETAEGIKLVIPELKSRGFRFVKLADYPLK